ncbi:MAG: LuxR C-terminal-related transcriptional regulator [Coriobacteriales bacterium]|jgi:DNA-binding CsgD family transcriptional regulator|nr:LuxR C-terminal-related transcriptional regulator [Coriobacteriales bacterium]
MDETTDNAPPKSPPIVEFNSREEERVIRPFMFLGFGAHLLWLVEVMVNCFPSSLIADPQTAQLYRGIGLVSAILAVVVMLCMGLFIDRITYYIRQYRLQIIAACCMTVATLLLLAFQDLAFVPLVILGSIVSGTASGYITLIWAEAFRRRDTPSIVLNTALAVATAVLGYGLLNVFASAFTTGIILCVLPLFSLMGMFMIMHGRRAMFRKQEFTVGDDGAKRPVYSIREVPTFRNLKVSKFRMLARLGLPSILWGLGLGSIAYLMRDFESGTTTDPQQFLLETAAGYLMALVVLGILTALNCDQSNERYYRFALPVIPIAILASILLRGTEAFGAFAFLCLGFILCAFLVWVELSEISHRYRISPILVSGFALAFFVAAALVSQPVMTLLVDKGSASGIWLSLVCVITLLVVAGALLLMPSEDDIRRMVVLDGEAALGSSEPFCADDEQKEQANRQKPARPRFVVRCEEVSDTYLLTARETDVLYLLAKGHSAAHIAKQLYIALGTVHTHTWHIYRKLDVHTQQGLIDLVDNQGYLECSQLNSNEEDAGYRGEGESNTVTT